MKRKIIKVDKEKCTGCGACVNGCPEGALQVIDGKAYVINETLCDGLGACIDTCPEDALSVEERQAESYDEQKVMENIIQHGPKVIAAHLKHLHDHGQTKYLKIAQEFLKEKGMSVPSPQAHGAGAHGGCPGARMMNFADTQKADDTPGQEIRQPSQLRQWPIQLHLVSPFAPYFEGKDVVLSADCVAYSVGNFHAKFLKGKSLAIACPKLDTSLDIYRDKITALIDEAKINTLTVMTMEVPCCMGLLRLTQQAVQHASRKVPLKHIIVGVRGDVIKEDWVST